MTDAKAGTSSNELEGLLAKLDRSRSALVSVLEEVDAARFGAADPEGNTIKAYLERTVDEVNFYYGRLVARALNLPQPPCMVKADFGSIREGTMALQVAHRRFSNLLHDLVPEDLAKTANDAELGSYTLRQVLEMAAGQYSMRAQQVQRLAGANPDSKEA